MRPHTGKPGHAQKDEENGTLWVGVGCAGVALGVHLLAGAWDLYACRRGACLLS